MMMIHSSACIQTNLKWQGLLQLLQISTILLTINDSEQNIVDTFKTSTHQPQVQNGHQETLYACKQIYILEVRQAYTPDFAADDIGVCTGFFLAAWDSCRVAGTGGVPRFGDVFFFPGRLPPSNEPARMVAPWNERWLTFNLNEIWL